MVAVINGPLSPTAVVSVSSGSSQSTDVSSSASSHARLLLLRLVHSAYRRWAYFIVAHAWAVILLCTLLCVLCTFKLATTPQVNDITGYTPYGARSRKELALRDQFFDSQGLGPPFGVFLLLLPRSPKENGNFMNAEMLAEAAKVDELVRHNFPLPNRATNRNETFVQFCRFFCDINEPLRRFEEGFRFQSAQQTVNQTTNPAIQLDYPVSTILGRKFNIQPNFFGIHFANSSSVAFPFSNMARVDMLALHYKAERIGHWSDEEVKRWEMAVSAHFEHQFESSLIRVLTASNTYVEMEVVRAGLSMLPFLIVGFTIMFCCTSVFMLLSAAYMGQLNAKKLWLALMACVCPFMATGTALGLLFLCGVRFGSVLCVTPFLVLAIGVDDAYLMIHAWQRVGSEQRWASGRAFGNGEMRQRMAVAERLALVLVDTGPAILISALTNICADAVGSLTGSPEITLLCVGNMAAIAVDFFFQVTFYAAVMVLVSQSELKAGKQFRVRIPVGWTAEDGEKPAANVANGSGSLGVVEVIRGGGKLSTAGRRRDRVKRQLNRLVDGYVRLITWPWAALGICLLWLAFLGFSAINVTKFEVNLSTKKLFASDSPLLEVDGYRERQIVPFFTMATIFVNSPGNLSDPARLHRLDQLVEAMENLPGSWGPQSTNYLVRELAQFVGDEEEEGTSLMDHLEDFLQWPEHAFWRAFVRRDNGTGKVEALLFTTAYHGDQLKVWAERTRLLKRWRAVVDQFGELNASVFHDEGIFLDLIDNMPDDAWQSALATLLCMCLICALFMGHDWKTVLVAGAVISSIMVGTLGILAWIDRTSMDPIMMAALLISIGFSVDIPAHVSYHFHSSLFEPSADDSHSVQRRFRQVLMSVGLPALQASFSTSLCVLALLFVPLYMATIFVRIMCTCILLCVLHSLLLMPALFALLDCARRRLGASSRRRGK